MKSNTEYRLKRTPEADADLTDIFQYTHDKWGAGQAGKYKNLLEKGFATLLANPEIGKVREAINCRCFLVAHHKIFYRIREQEIQIIRVLGGAMDVEAHIP